MTWIHPARLEYERRRFTRPDAYGWQRPDQVDDNTPSYLRKYRAALTDRSRGATGAMAEAELLDYRLALARLRLDWELLKFELRGQKAGFHPNQPRDDRGRWNDTFGSFRIVAAGVPRIPQKRPPDSRDRTATYKKVAEWVAENGPRILDGIAKTSWVYPALPIIRSYLDAPKTLGELQDDLSPKAGYDRHHIVEQTSAEEAGYPRKRIDDQDNLVRIPQMKHWQINAWYQTSGREFGGVSPREYLVGKDWHERRRIGLEALRRFEVLKP